MVPRRAFVLCLVLSLSLMAAWGLSTSGVGLQAAPIDDPQAPTAPAFELGEPGLSYGFEAAFGEYAIGYFTDTVHLNYPEGISTDGTQIWIAEGPGVRLLTYGSDGGFIDEIGQAGYRMGIPGTQVRHLTDVEIDPDGNIWFADAAANHVVRLDAGGAYSTELGVVWEPGSGNGHFQYPSGLAFDSKGNLYVSDGVGSAWSGGGGNHRIQIFDPAGAYLHTIGVTAEVGADNAHFNEPVHIHIDTADRLYVADASNHRIQIYDVSSPAAPTYVATLGVSGEAGADDTHLSRPAGVTVGDAAIFVADTGNHRIQIFDLATRTYSATLGTGRGTGDYEFDTPTDVALDADGNLYVADVLNQRVMQYSPDLVYQRTYGITGVPYLTDDRHYFTPAAVAPTADGGMLVLEENGHRLTKLSAAGEPEWTLGEAGKCGADDVHLCSPRDSVVDASGRILVADTWNHRVQVYDAAGQYQATVGTGRGDAMDQFDAPEGVAVGSDGRLYVADTRNHRIQIFDSAFAYISTMGETGVSGTDAEHFNTPADVKVDMGGRIYVVDHGNHRVQVFAPDGTLALTLGVTGECGDDLGHLCLPTAVAVDSQGHIAVADRWGDRILVYDDQGAYLTGFGNSWGSGSGSINLALGLAADDNGALYVPEYLAHRVKVFAPGVPDWQQMNLNGFGDPDNTAVTALDGFGSRLYAGVTNAGYTGARIYASTDGRHWTPVIGDGFGSWGNRQIAHLYGTDQALYAATENADKGAELWRSSDGSNWTRVIAEGFEDPTNVAFSYLDMFQDNLYLAASKSVTATTGAEIWRSANGNPGSWARVVARGFGNTHNDAIPVLKAVDGVLYAGTSNPITGGEIWRSSTGDDGFWSQVNTGGFGNPDNTAVACLGHFGAYIYAGTHNAATGAEIWRSPDGTTWSQVVSAGFGAGAVTDRVDALVAYSSGLYAVAGNAESGMGIWFTSDGETWSQPIPSGFGLHDNAGTSEGAAALSLYRGRLFLGTTNTTNGAQIWMLDNSQSVFVPFITRVSD